MHARRSTARAAVVLAAAATVAVALPGPASAVPPRVLGPFPVDEAVEEELAAHVLATCGVEVTVEGSGSVVFRQFLTRDGEVRRALGLFHTTLVLTTTSGRATAFLGFIGRQVGDGQVAGRDYHICAGLT